MSRINNTAEQDPLLNMLSAMEPQGIERQEKEGQSMLVAASQLPSEINGKLESYGVASVAEFYERFGIKVRGSSPGDNLFLDVELPAGWKLLATKHAMWSALVDERGRKRGSIFYKAAFYDRGAHFSPNRRFDLFVVSRLPFDAQRPKMEYYEEKRITPIYGVVEDTGTEIFSTPKDHCFTDVYVKENHDEWHRNFEALQIRRRDECRQFLAEKYPDWENYFAYWD